MTKTRKIQVAAWGTSLAVTLLAVIAWGESYTWGFLPFSTYRLFPLFGLLAFSLMWAHYVAAAVRRYFELEKSALKGYFEVTSAVVLAAILLHPGLLIWQLWRDGFGLPFGSLQEYAGVLYGAVWFGITAWAIFMLYELRRWFHDKPWWKFMQYASDIAMVLIFFHALQLGGALQLEWFRMVWYFYGAVFLASLIYQYGQALRDRSQNA